MLESRLLLFATGGDFNGDGIVAAADLVLVRTHWGAVVQEQLAGWVGMQPDDRVDQNELDAVLLNWLQIVDPADQGSAAEADELAVSVVTEPAGPAPLLENALSSASEVVADFPAGGDLQGTSSTSKTPIPRAVRHAAYSALAEGRVGALDGRVKQLVAMRLAASEKGLAGMDIPGAGRGERDAAFAQLGTGGWLSIGRIAKWSSLESSL